MNEKTETRPQEEMKRQVEEITDYYAKRWYNIGFLFAVNYIYTRLAESEDPEFTQEKFKEFCDNRLGDVIDEKYFEKFPFYTDNNPYGAGMCPGDLPNTCIPCTGKKTIPIPRNK